MSGIIRAFRCELAINRDYLLKMLAVWLLIVALVAATAGLVVAVPTALLLAVLLSAAAASGVQDDAGTWSSYEMCLPLSRRDVVLGRYLYMLALAVGAVVAGIAVAAVFAVLGVGLDGIGVPDGALNAAGGEGISRSALTLAVMATALVFAIGYLLAGFMVALYFAIGATKLTQYLWFIWLAIICVLLVLTKLLPEGVGTVRLDEPLESAAFVGGCVAFGLAALAVSAVVAVRLYERRDL